MRPLPLFFIRKKENPTLHNKPLSFFFALGASHLARFISSDACPLLLSSEYVAAILCTAFVSGGGCSYQAVRSSFPVNRMSRLARTNSPRIHFQNEQCSGEKIHHTPGSSLPRGSKPPIMILNINNISLICGYLSCAFYFGPLVTYGRHLAIFSFSVILR